MCKAGGVQIWLKCAAVCSFFGEKAAGALKEQQAEAGKPPRKGFCRPGNRVERERKGKLSALETGWKAWPPREAGEGPGTPPSLSQTKGVLLKVLGDHKELVRDLGPYERISRSGAVDPKGLVHNLDLLRDLLRTEPTGEVTPNR